MTNILEAINNICINSSLEVRSHTSARNRANSIGDALESYIKDAFAGCIHINDEQERNKRYSEVFSWIGNQNHPPDIMIKEGAAIEVKKIQNPNSDLALNSSYPKSILKVDNEMLTQACKTCETWTEKDIVYCIGHTTDNHIKSLWMVYGTIYAAEPETYQTIKKKITQGIEQIPHVELSETKELGRVNKVDPLGITNLRIRGMWQIQNPRKVYSYLYKSDNDYNFELVALIPLTNYQTFPPESIQKIENNKQINITDVKVKNPNNPAKLIDCKLIILKK